MLIKEFDLDLDTISNEFEGIENIIISDAMNFYMKQFDVSFKHYRVQNVLRLADYLVDYGPQRYGKPLAYFIERLIKHEVLDEAKYFLDQFGELVRNHLSEFILQKLDTHVVEEGAEIQDIDDSFSPIT